MGNYDKIMRENLGSFSKQLMGTFLHEKISKIIPLPPKIKKTVIEKEKDGLFLVKTKSGKEFIVHFEYQVSNDIQMIYRMAAYAYGIQLRNQSKEVVSIVIYVGRDRMNMPNKLTFGKNHYEFQLIDIRDLSPETFLNLEDPREVIFAILTGRNEKQRKLLANKIITKLCALTSSESELAEALEDLEIISSLRSKQTETFINQRKETMALIIDVRKTQLYKRAKLEGITEGEARGTSNGFKKGIISTAKNMLKDGVNISLISKYTGLSIQQLNKLKSGN